MQNVLSCALPNIIIICLQFIRIVCAENPLAVLNSELWKSLCRKLQIRWDSDPSQTNPPQTPANPPSERLCLRAAILVGSLYLPLPSPPPLGDQEG